MKYTIITLLLLSVLVTLTITFDEAYALADRDHTKPTVIFDKITYDDKGEINLTCVNNDPEPTVLRKVTWIIPQTNQHDRIMEEQTSDYSFLATDFLNNGEQIKCRTVWLDGHARSSDWVKSSNFESLSSYDDTFANLIPPVLVSDKQIYQQSEEITLTCDIDDSIEVSQIYWYVKPNVIYSPNNFPVWTFSADYLGIGTHNMHCTYSDMGSGSAIGSSISIIITKDTLPIVDDPIVDDPIVDDPIVDDPIVDDPIVDDSVPDENFADIHYNPITHDITIEWNFGTKDSRENCYTKTDFGIDYMINGTLYYDPYHTFFGTDTTLYDVEGLSENIIINEDMAIISCAGEFTFNINDFKILDNFSGFEFWTSFYEKVDDKPHILNQVGMIYSEDIIIMPDPCFVNNIDFHTDVYYDTIKHLKLTGVDISTKKCDNTVEQHDGVIPVNYTSVDFITYEEYPPHNTHNTHNTDNTKKKNGGGGSPPPPPTFGKDKNYNQIVTDGFCFNGICVDVDKLHTDYPQINATVGEISTITTKSHNPNGGLDGLKWIQVILGLKEAGIPLSNGEVIATFYLDKTEIDKIEIVDKNNLIELYELSTGIVQCSDEYTTECLELSFSFIPRDKLIHNVVGIDVVNLKNSGTINYLNHGVEFHGDSLNEPLISYTSASKGGAFYPQDRGTVELSLVNYSESLWQDEYGYLWKMNNYGFYIIDTVPVPLKEPDVMWSAMTRINSNFVDIIITEQDRAILVFDSTKLISELPDSFAYDLPKSAEEQQAELDIRINNEIDRLSPLTKDYAKNQHLYQKDSYSHWNYFGDMTLAEINQLDMKNKQKLQDEMLQQRLDDKAKYG